MELVEMKEMKKKTKHEKYIRVFVIPFLPVKSLLSTHQRFNNNFLRNERICFCLTKYFEKMKKFSLGGILVVGEDSNNLKKIREKFNEDFSMLLVCKWFKQKELIFDLKQKKKFVLTTYNDVFGNQAYLPLLKYIDTIFFITPCHVPSTSNLLVKTLLISNPQRKNCSIIDLLDDLPCTRKQFKKRAEFYTANNIKMKFESC